MREFLAWPWLRETGGLLHLLKGIHCSDLPGSGGCFATLQDKTKALQHVATLCSWLYLRGDVVMIHAPAF